MRTIKYKVCELTLARVVDGLLSAAWEDDVLKHMTDTQVANYVRRKYGLNVVVLKIDNVVKEIDATDAYNSARCKKVVKENNYE